MKCWIVAALGFALICASVLVGFIAHDYINDNILSKAPNSQNSSNATSALGNDQHLTEDDTVPISNITEPDASEYLDGISTKLRIGELGTRLPKQIPQRNFPQKPYLIGLTGTIGSGKSSLAKYFKTLGAEVIDCDQLAHEIYEPNTQCYAKLVLNFGKNILNQDLRINRTKLGEIVFQDKEKLDELNGIVWPFLEFEIQHRIEEVRRTHQVVIIEAAILLQAGWQDRVHEVWSVIIPPELAIQRIQNRNGLTEIQAKQRIAAQPSNDEMIKESNVIFSTQWSNEFSLKQAEIAWAALQEYLKAPQSKP